MKLKIKNREVELKFTFNSFKFMGDFNLSELEELENKPFLIAPLAMVLTVGAVNNNPKVVYSEDEVAISLENFVSDENNDIGELLEFLITQLQESNFFKSLQKNKPQVEAK